jgi:SAM-dependent methyltransferase
MDEGKTIIFVSHAPSAIRAICRRVCVLEQGKLAFDGDLEPGLAFYDWLLARRAHGDGSTGSAAQPASAGDDEADLDRAPHRTIGGGLWRETGRWQFEFLKQQGLMPRQYMLDVGCGSLSAGLHLLPFLDEHHYWGFERNRALLECGVWIELPRAGVVPERGHFVINDTFELDAIPDTFDFALASFAYMPFDSVARCIAGVLRKLKPSGRFYATWFADPDPANLDPIVHSNGVTTYPDREPYHYPFELIAHSCRAVGGTVERVADATHPRGESVMVISRRFD